MRIRRTLHTKHRHSAAGAGQPSLSNAYYFALGLPTNPIAEEAAQASRLVPKSDFVVELDKSTYLDLLRNHDEIFMEFYANWCSACHGLSPEFNAFAEAARDKYPSVVVARVDITKVEYLSSSFMVGMLPEIVYIRRPAPGATHEVRYSSANFTRDDLLSYVGGGWVEDKPIGGYSTVWCTPTNFCGHIGGLIGEGVVYLDQRFNRFDIPPWAFMAIIVSLIYAVGQMLVAYLARLTRRKYHERINRKHDDAPGVVHFDEYRSDLAVKKDDGGTGSNEPSTPTSSKSARHGSATKRSKSKRSKKD
ncbi:hypothetical protein GQ54DRAFT_317206 [Martensiomyces pterosporus]|nr:hypothetical protein GQ54DRAFT_317206 [Martensiomyces pterosporus]